MVVQLSPRIEASIARLVATGHYTDANDVIGAGLRLLAEQEHTHQIHLRALILEGFASGDPVELTDDLMHEIEREAEEAVRRGDVLSPHVCP